MAIVPRSSLAHTLLLVLFSASAVGGRRHPAYPSPNLEALRELPVASTDEQQAYDAWRSSHGIVFEAEENDLRGRSWAATARELEIERRGGTKISARLELNDRAALTRGERLAALNPGYLVEAEKLAEEAMPTDKQLLRSTSAHAGRDLPASVDWRSAGIVSDVKQQGACGGCYSFAAQGVLEGLLALRDGVLVSLSEQHVLDCSRHFGNEGCKGGSFRSAWDFIHSTGGTYSEAMLPYAESDAEACGDGLGDDAVLVATIRGNIAQAHSSVELAALVAERPVAVAVDASSLAFQLYNGGILDSPSCGDAVNHAVVVVGYGEGVEGEEAGVPYWLIKNSWGTSWGESGYMRLARGFEGSTFSAAGACGVLKIALAPSSGYCVAPDGDCRRYNNSAFCSTTNHCTYPPPSAAEAEPWWAVAWDWLRTGANAAIVTGALVALVLVAAVVDGVRSRRRRLRREAVRFGGWGGSDDEHGGSGGHYAILDPIDEEGEEYRRAHHAQQYPLT